MTHESYNPGDPLFLVSRDIDGDLSKDESDRLEDAFRSSESFRMQADRLRRVDRVVRQWGSEGVEIDWKHHAALITELTRAERDEDDLTRVDGLLAEWAQRKPVLDPRDFAQGVLERINPRRNAPAGWTWRIGAPLAAAAAIALTVTASLWFGPHSSSVAIVSIGRVESNHVLKRGVEPRVIVSFARPTTDTQASANDAPDIGYMTIGSSPLPRAWDEPAPL